MLSVCVWACTLCKPMCNAQDLATCCNSDAASFWRQVIHIDHAMLSHTCSTSQTYAQCSGHSVSTHRGSQITEHLRKHPAGHRWCAWHVFVRNSRIPPCPNAACTCSCNITLQANYESAAAASSCGMAGWHHSCATPAAWPHPTPLNPCSVTVRSIT